MASFCQNILELVSEFTTSWWCRLLALASQFCCPKFDLTCNISPWFNNLALCSCALARKQAIELFLNASGSSLYAWWCSFSAGTFTFRGNCGGGCWDWEGWLDAALVSLASVRIEVVSSWSLLLLQLSSLRCSAASNDLRCIPASTE